MLYTLYDTTSGQQCFGLKDKVVFIFKGAALKSFFLGASFL